MDPKIRVFFGVVLRVSLPPGNISFRKAQRASAVRTLANSRRAAPAGKLVTSIDLARILTVRGSSEPHQSISAVLAVAATASHK